MFSAFPYGADAAIVEVDPETGKVDILRYVSVHDCGNVLNPLILEGQHIGALAHGVGGVMSEEFTFGEDGQPININFATYLLPSAVDVPEFELDYIISPNPFTPGGYKGGGETGTVSPPPCLTNAVEDALQPLGLDVYRHLPLSPPNVLREIDRARLQTV
jgi:carbon-monoxide dehydrogenase large subunit